MNKYSQLLARIFLSVIFIQSGISKIFNAEATGQYMASKGLPGILLIPTIVVLLGGGLSIVIGYKAKIGAWLLIGFLIPTTLIFHTDFPAEKTDFFKNLGLMGGLLMVANFGAGDISLDK
jgi:putative oxidoreductase